MRRFVFCLCMAASIFWPSCLFGSVNSRYTVAIHEAEPLRAFVKATIVMTGDTLYMNPNCPNYDYPEGWASFIRNLSVKDPEGRSVSSRYQPKSEWILTDKTADSITLSYEVDLSFAKLKWDVGNEQAGFFDGKAVYVVSKALFIHPREDGASTVTFDLPEDWKLSVPWKAAENNTYHVPNREFLVDNSLVFGDFYSAELGESPFDFRIALLGEAGESGDLFGATLKQVANAYLQIFEGTPPSIYLITVFYADLDDGESFFNSNTFTLKERMDEDSKIIWANQMAHELFHYWNSDLIRAESYADRQWFSEGTAEYYANMTLVRKGIIGEPTFRSKMEKILGLYENFRGWKETTTSLLKSGEHKGRNRFLVYNGGWAVAMALDVEIMEKTGGRKTLDDFMQAMFTKYNATPYSYSDLVKTAGEVAGTDLNDFFAKYVEGTELLPLHEYVGKLGYRMLDVIYEAEVYLVPQTGDGNLRNLWLRVHD